MYGSLAVQCIRRAFEAFHAIPESGGRHRPHIVVVTSSDCYIAKLSLYYPVCWTRKSLATIDGKHGNRLILQLHTCSVALANDLPRTAVTERDKVEAQR